MDSGQLNCIVFLDVRKAFDSINHEILIDKMRKFFGITGIKPTKMVRIIPLNNRVQQCLINGQLSSPKKDNMKSSTGVHPSSSTIFIIYK